MKNNYSWIRVILLSCPCAVIFIKKNKIFFSLVPIYGYPLIRYDF